MVYYTLLSRAAGLVLTHYFIFPINTDEGLIMACLHRHRPLPIPYLIGLYVLLNLYVNVLLCFRTRMDTVEDDSLQIQPPQTHVKKDKSHKHKHKRNKEHKRGRVCLTHRCHKECLIISNNNLNTVFHTHRVNIGVVILVTQYVRLSRECW